mgnify:CR=1 FL=1
MTWAAAFYARGMSKKRNQVTRSPLTFVSDLFSLIVLV